MGHNLQVQLYSIKEKLFLKLRLTKHFLSQPNYLEIHITAQSHITEGVGLQKKTIQCGIN